MGAFVAGLEISVDVLQSHPICLDSDEEPAKSPLQPPAASAIPSNGVGGASTAFPPAISTAAPQAAGPEAGAPDAGLLDAETQLAGTLQQEQARFELAPAPGPDRCAALDDSLQPGPAGKQASRVSTSTDEQQTEPIPTPDDCLPATALHPGEFIETASDDPADVAADRQSSVEAPAQELAASGPAHDCPADPWPGGTQSPETSELRDDGPIKVRPQPTLIDHEPQAESKLPLSKQQTWYRPVRSKCVVLFWTDFCKKQ